MSSFFRFASSHRLDAPQGAVFAVLAEAETWDQWWPQIRSIRPYSETTGQVRIRSLLPFTLVLELTSEVVDARSGVLRASLSGDLEGWAQFTVTAARGAGAAPAGGGRIGGEVGAGATRAGGGREESGTRLDYVQEAALVRPQLPAALAYALRPVLIANHALMMRSGMRGLAVRAHRPPE